MAESYYALDTLAAAVFQSGVAVFIGGVTIGLALVVRYRGIVIVGSFVVLLAGVWAALAMIDPHDGPPTARRLAEKKRDVVIATVVLVLTIIVVVLLMSLVILPVTA